ncbi:CHAT domain-containing protein [Streptomyces sp. NBC_01363]|uniref:CHAT domain-containing protein n=1 Tax=Streptomyces sp. NBC_01363 TaxID=2903840 RepID=UPI0022542BB8|nr:CHAT domain-containing protein [Streptomyces sp. NBC_01363]MCX4731275.1 CHAT domain-containing protein [Streptomyces sp. NBC_01363]
MTYPEIEENGGVRALRTWVMAATKRALRLYPPGSPGAGPDVYDRSIAELDELTRLLEHDAELRATVSVQLGSVLAMRHLARGGVPADRERARRLLREARDPATATGAATDADDRRWAALSLLSLVLPVPQQDVRSDQPPSLSGLLDWRAELGPAGMAAAVVEMRELLDEVQELPLPPEQHEQLRRTGAVLAQLAGPDSPVRSMRAFMDAMSGGVPYEDELRKVTDLLSDLSDPPAEPAPAARAEAPAPPGPPPGPPPGGTEAFAAMNAVVPSLFEAFDAFRSGDPQTLDQALGRLRDAHGLMPSGHELGPQLEMLSATLLQLGQATGGSLHDGALGRTVMETLGDRNGLFTPDPANPIDREFAVLLRVVPLSVRLRTAHEAEDVGAVRAIHAELVALDTETPRDHKLRYLVMGGLAQSCITLGMLTDDSDMMLRGADHFEQATAAADSLPPLFRDLVDQAGLGPDALRARVTNDATLLRNHAPAPSDAPRGQQWLATMSLALKYGLTHDPAHLPPLIGELERIRDEIRQGRQPWFAADALWQLAVAYRARRHHTEDATAQAAATDTALEALHVLAGDVILQRGAEHGLLTARSGAERGVRTAVWAASQGRAEDALAALELGRALVLHAASTSRAVPELLEARGHEELAAAWRASGTRDTDTEDGPPGELPSTLRRRALEALGHRQQRLFTTPTAHELADGLAEAGADALVYLLPGEGETPGVGIVVGPDHSVGVGGLPLLSDTGSAPLERYLDAAAARSRQLGDPAAEQAWEEALSELCDWAYRAGLEEILHAVEGRLDSGASGHDRRPGPLRIVLVPCGRLGVVPWHAARLPAAAPHDYVCQNVVISYASSGGQLLQTIKRAQLDPAAAPVLIADPRQELTHAEREAAALHEAFYPRARMYGEFYEPPVEPVATGTPDEVLALLSESPSLLHVASHGSAGVRPTVSALHLAFPDGTDMLPPEEGGPGAVPDLGMLTVTRLLDRPSDEASAPHGPLVVLSACETDLSTRDHDEALTLTTSFVSGGARNVVGSRWTTRDGASALMMAVFHHYLAVEGQGPADALRAAQLWMLDPDRRNRGSLSGGLLREIQRPGLDRLLVWAAFIHQGHPGSGQTTTATTARTASAEGAA